MNMKNLEYLFNPKSLALIGASKKLNSMGNILAKNLLNVGFQGVVMPVNPKEKSIEGVISYNSVDDLPIVPDLAIIATPPATVPKLVKQLAEKGTKAAVVITAGFGEGDDKEGAKRKQEMLDAVKEHDFRIIGPNCLGIMVPSIGLNASFSHVEPLEGDIAFVTQSGSIATSMVDWATAKGIGFSHVISVGAMSDVDFGDMLEYLAEDEKTKSVILYIEAITDAEEFIKAAKKISFKKPVVAIKSGRHEEGMKAIASHTGSLAGADEVYDAAFARTGVLRVYAIDEMFDAVQTLAHMRDPGQGRLAILTNGGGLGIVGVDSLLDDGGTLAKLSKKTMDKLNKVLPATWSHANPIDIIGDAPKKRYEDSLEILLDDPNIDAILVMNCPVAIVDSTDGARAIVDILKKKKSNKYVLTSWLGEIAPDEARQIFADEGIPSYDTPGKAVRAYMYMVRYHQALKNLKATDRLPKPRKIDQAAVRKIIDKIADGRKEFMLSELDAKDVFEAYGIPITKSFLAKTPEEAKELSAKIKGAKVLKILSDDITHKSDVGGVRLNLKTPEDVELATKQMLSTIKADFPDAKIDGVAVQEMISLDEPYELIIGMNNDVTFGPVILFGQGGTGVEVIKDKALGLPPLNLDLATEMISRTRISKRLAGYRDRPPVKIKQIAEVLVRISLLVQDFPEIQELDINPLLADASTVIAVDGRIRIELK